MRFRNHRIAFIFWGLMDLLHMGWYVVAALRLGKTPYIDDLSMFMESSAQHGGPAVFVFGALTWCLQLTIPISAILLLSNSSVARVFCYLQTPIRLLTITPSLTFIPIAIAMTGSWGVAFTIAALICSEVLKILTLKEKGSGSYAQSELA